LSCSGGRRARPAAWSQAAAAWHRLERPPLAAYCRWRQAEALVAAARTPHRRVRPTDERVWRGSADRSATPAAGARATRRTRTTRPRAREDGNGAAGRALGLTPRELEVLALLAKDLTNREIADELVIGVKTVGIHVSHILRKLDVPTPVEAAAIAHRIAPA
jgi:DNA-binding NarL/FixJ family response regulator